MYPYLLCVCLCTCVFVCVCPCVCVCTHAKAPWHTCGGERVAYRHFILSFLHEERLNSGHWAWLEEPLPIEHLTSPMLSYRIIIVIIVIIIDQLLVLSGFPILCISLPVCSLLHYQHPPNRFIIITQLCNLYWDGFSLLSLLLVRDRVTILRPQPQVLGSYACVTIAGFNSFLVL